MGLKQLMQTFLPYEGFNRSAKALDRQRLGKQRLEAKTILEINLGLSQGTGWRNHPAVLMWKGHEGMLAMYGIAVSLEWRSRGYKDQHLDYFRSRLREIGSLVRPSWLGNEEFHSSHRAALLYKLPSWYGLFKWKEEPGISYFWPVRKS